MTFTSAFLLALLGDETEFTETFDQIDGACPAALFGGWVANIFNLVEDLELIEGLEGHFVDENGGGFGDLDADFAFDVFDVGTNAASVEGFGGEGGDEREEDQKTENEEVDVGIRGSVWFWRYHCENGDLDLGGGN